MKDPGQVPSFWGPPSPSPHLKPGLENPCHLHQDHKRESAVCPHSSVGRQTGQLVELQGLGPEIGQDKPQEARGRETWVSIRTWLLPGCMALGESLFLSEPPFPHLQKGHSRCEDCRKMTEGSTVYHAHSCHFSSARQCSMEIMTRLYPACLFLI